MKTDLKIKLSVIKSDIKKHLKNSAVWRDLQMA